VLPRVPVVERVLRVAGPLPPDQAWERYAVPARWAPHLRRVDTTAARIAPGVRGRVHGPPGVAVMFVVAEVDERARTWAWDVQLPLGPFGPLRLHLRHGVEADPTGTATWLLVRGPAPAVLAYLPVARLALRRLVRP
jgi:hypothetical protein